MAAARGDACNEVRLTMVGTSSEPARDGGEPAPAMRISEWGREDVAVPPIIGRLQPVAGEGP